MHACRKLTKGWARSALWQMLRNPLYAGTYYWNRTEWVKTDHRRVMKPRKTEERLGHVGNAPELAIIKDAMWKLVQLRLNLNNGKEKNKRLQMGGKAVYMLSGLLMCKCGAHFVLDSATHYSCAAAKDGRACKNTIRVRRDVAERVILTPVIDELLAPDMVDEMVVEMRKHYAHKMAEAKAEQAKRPAEVVELERRIARLQDRLKAGDPDMAADELMAVIEKAEAKRAALLSEQPEARRAERILHALPAAAKQYRDQITRGLKNGRKVLQENPTEAGRARVAVRRLLGNTIRLEPAKGGKHLVAHYQFHRAALLGSPMAAAVGFVGSGGTLT
jgi:hypothetical protein